MNATITLREYINKGKCFVVPNYQRGYIWGKKKFDGGRNAVEYMLDSLISGFDSKTEVFIQGITVSELDDKIILIDGQQRTTFFYLLLKWLGYSGKVFNGKEFKMEYSIRKQSNEFLNSNILADYEENQEEEFQDIYFFKRTIRIICEKFHDFDDEEKKKEVCEYVLDHVKFLYIDIPEEKAITVFTMMNGNKAEMKAEELIKAELLRLASLNKAENSKVEDKETYAVEWDNNMLRSRYAREWDKWLQWWNRDDVKKLYRVDCMMGYLVSTYQRLSKTSQLSFENFRNEFLTEQESKKAKQTFDGLRRLQKRFEDVFNDPIVYNRVGAIIRIFDKDNKPDKDAFIEWYFLGKVPTDAKTTRKDGLYDLGETPKDKLERYYKLAFLKLTHKEIISSYELHEQETIKNKFDDRYSELCSNNLYGENPEAAFRLLLRLNIDEDNLQENEKGRNFDFSIWDRTDSRGRSLEHIYPKSKVYHKEKLEDGNEIKEIIKNGNGDLITFEEGDEKQDFIWREDCRCKDTQNKEEVEIIASEHSIGNLVLLYKDDNSSFNNSTFEEKKGIFFKKPEKNRKVKDVFKSRHLLHTIYTFATSKWGGEEIAKHKNKTINDFKTYYNDILNEDGKE